MMCINKKNYILIFLIHPIHLLFTLLFILWLSPKKLKLWLSPKKSWNFFKYGNATSLSVGLVWYIEYEHLISKHDSLWQSYCIPHQYRGRFHQEISYTVSRKDFYALSLNLSISGPYLRAGMLGFLSVNPKTFWNELR